MLSNGEHLVFKASNKNSMAVSILVSTLANAVLVKEGGSGDVPGEWVACKLVQISWDEPLTKYKAATDCIGLGKCDVGPSTLHRAPRDLYAQLCSCQVLNWHGRSTPSSPPSTGVTQGERLGSGLGLGWFIPCSCLLWTPAVPRSRAASAKLRGEVPWNRTEELARLFKSSIWVAFKQVPPQALLERRSPFLPGHWQAELQPPSLPRVWRRVFAWAPHVRPWGGTAFPSSPPPGARTHAPGPAAQHYKGGAGAGWGMQAARGAMASEWRRARRNGYFLSYSSSSSSSHSLLPSLSPGRGRGEKGRRGVEPAPLAELRPLAPGLSRWEGPLRSAGFPTRPEALRGVTACPVAPGAALSRCRPLLVPAGPLPSYLTVGTQAGTGRGLAAAPASVPRSPQFQSGLERPQSWCWAFEGVWNAAGTRGSCLGRSRFATDW